MSHLDHPALPFDTRLARLVLIAGFALLSLAPAAFAQTQIPPRDTRPAAAPEVGTGRISGQVVAADTGAPVKRAQVMVTGGTPVRVSGAVAGASPSGMPPGMVRKDAQTDDAGHFDFRELPAGTFSVMVMPTSGFVAPDRSLTVKLDDGQASAVTIRLGRTGVITGRILDESGDPMDQVRVTAMRRSPTGGRPSQVGRGSMATTDDLGHFRLYGLPPGDYYVKATYEQWTPPTMTGPKVGYGPTYYPGAPSLENARLVAVRSGQESGGADFMLTRVPLAKISGIATDSTGKPLLGGAGMSGGSVMISSRDEPGSSRGPGLRADGQFEITNVAPGDYFVCASAYRGPGPATDREAACVPVTVNGSDITLNIQTNRGATISGRIVIEGTGDDPMSTLVQGANARRGQVMVRPEADQPYGFAGRPAEIAEDGTFELTGVRGSVRLQANGIRGMLKSVSIGGQDATTKPLALQGTEKITDAVLTFTTDTGYLTGQVTSDGKEPAGDQSVVIFADDPERWYAGSPSTVITRTLSAETASAIAARRSTPASAQLANALNWTPTAGAFAPMRLLPGRYLVAVAGDSTINMGSGLAKEYLEKLRESATPVTVLPGETATVQLQLK